MIYLDSLPGTQTYNDELFENGSEYSLRLLIPGQDEPFSASLQLSTCNELESTALPVPKLAILDSVHNGTLAGSTLCDLHLPPRIARALIFHF